MNAEPGPFERAARQLADAATTSVPVGQIGPAPRDLIEGYRIQAAGHDLHGEALRGWKAGCTSAAAQEFLGIEAPVSGRYRESHVLATPASLTAEQFAMPPRLEVEIGLRLLADLDVVPDDPMELAVSVDAFAAIEVVAGRLTSFPLLAAPELVADNVAGARMIVGSSLGLDPSGIRRLDETAVSLDIDGTEVASGTGSAALGHPLRVLAWLVDHATALGAPLRSGDLVITGTCTGMTLAQAGVRHIGRVGDVAVQLDVE